MDVSDDPQVQAAAKDAAATAAAEIDPVVAGQVLKALPGAQVIVDASTGRADVESAIRALLQTAFGAWMLKLGLDQNYAAVLVPLVGIGFTLAWSRAKNRHWAERVVTAARTLPELVHVKL